MVLKNMGLSKCSSDFTVFIFSKSCLTVSIFFKVKKVSKCQFVCLFIFTAVSLKWLLHVQMSLKLNVSSSHLYCLWSLGLAIKNVKCLRLAKKNTTCFLAKTHIYMYHWPPLLNHTPNSSECHTKKYNLPHKQILPFPHFEEDTLITIFHFTDLQVE